MRQWGLDILSALRYLHDRDPVIMHRDLKPANILLPSARGARLRLSDFGLAKSFDRAAAQLDAAGAAVSREGSGGVLVRAHTSKVPGPTRHPCAHPACTPQLPAFSTLTLALLPWVKR